MKNCNIRAISQITINKFLSLKSCSLYLVLTCLLSTIFRLTFQIIDRNILISSPPPLNHFTYFPVGHRTEKFCVSSTHFHTVLLSLLSLRNAISEGLYCMSGKIHLNWDSIDIHWKICRRLQTLHRKRILWHWMLHQIYLRRAISTDALSRTIPAYLFFYCEIGHLFCMEFEFLEDRFTGNRFD